MTHETPIVDPPMVMAAEQGPVVEVGTAAVSPVDQMMRVTPLRRHSAAGIVQAWSLSHRALV